MVVKLDEEVIEPAAGPLVFVHNVETIVWPPVPVAVPLMVIELAGNCTV